MSATRNIYHTINGNGTLPGDVKLTDTADASLTADKGVAATPKMVGDVLQYVKGLFYIIKTTPVPITSAQTNVLIDFGSQIPDGYTPLVVFQPETNGWVGSPMIYNWVYPSTQAQVYVGIMGTGTIDFWVLCYWTGKK